MQPTLYFRLSLLQFLQYFVLGAWFVTAGTYLLRTLHFSGREVGLVYGGMSLAATLTPFFMGMVADRLFASERLLAVLHAGAGVAMLLMSEVSQFGLFYPLLLLHACLYIPTMALSTALCFHHVADGQRDFPRIRVWGTVGFILAGLLVSYLDVEVQVLPLRIAGVALFVLSLYCLTLPHTPPRGRRGRFRWQDIFGEEVIALFRRRNFKVLVIALTVISIPSGFYYSFVNPFLNEIGMERAAGKMALGQVSEIVFMLALPFFFRQWGVRWILFTGLLAWGVRYILFALGGPGPGLWLLYPAILLHGVAFNFTVVATQIFLDRSVPPSIRSTTQGFISLVTQGVGAFVGAYIAGEVVGFFVLPAQMHNWPAIWSVPALVGLATAVFFLAGFRRAKG